METFVQGPNDTLDYVWDFMEWLEGDTISQHTVTSSVPSEFVVTNPGTTDGKVVVWLSGGTLGRTYTVSCKITTLSGRVKEERAAFKILKN